MRSHIFTYLEIDVQFGELTGERVGMDSHYKFPASRLKTDQFFLHWLAQPENQELVRT